MVTRCLDLKAQEEVDKAYQSPSVWTAKSILSTAGCGKFSCDRTIKEYAEDIWNIRVIFFFLVIYSNVFFCSQLDALDQFR
jgi:hypothetical protein